jgi:hypothetical protein
VISWKADSALYGGALRGEIGHLRERLSPVKEARARA